MMGMMNRCARWGKNRSAGLLLIRIAMGLVFLTHGWMKIHNVGMVEGMFIGFGLPSATGVFIAWLEVIGGAALILGVLPRIFALAFAIEMLVAIFLTGGIAKGYRPHELELVLMLGSLGIALAGSGRYSLWACECHSCGAMKCKEGECVEKK